MLSPTAKLGKSQAQFALTSKNIIDLKLIFGLIFAETNWIMIIKKCDSPVKGLSCEVSTMS